MSVVINGTTGITSSGGYTGDGLTVADGAPAGAVTVDSSGNLGLGVTPSAWGSGSSQKALQISSVTSVAGDAATARVINNAYIDGSSVDRYVTSQHASAYAQNAGRHLWFTAPSGTAGNPITFTQAMTLDASGNLLVGLTSVPSLVGGGYRQLVVGGSSGGVLDVGTATTSYGRVSADVNGLNLESIGATFTAFRTNGSERARLDSSGNLLVGTTTTNPTGNATGISLANNVQVYFSTSQTSTFFHNLFYNGNGLVGSIVTSGTGTSYNTSSDYRLKENIQPMIGALAKVAALKPCTYKWKSDGSDGEGFIAHELAEVVPQCVTGEKDAIDADGKPVYQGIDTSFLVATLTAAIQELNAKVEAQAAEIAALKGAV